MRVRSWGAGRAVPCRDSGNASLGQARTVQAQCRQSRGWRLPAALTAHCCHPTALQRNLLKALLKLDEYLSTPLEHELAREPHLRTSLRRFLDGDQLTLADCNLLPKLNIVQVRGCPCYTPSFLSLPCLLGAACPMLSPSPEYSPATCLQQLSFPMCHPLAHCAPQMPGTPQLRPSTSTFPDPTPSASCTECPSSVLCYASNVLWPLATFPGSHQ